MMKKYWLLMAALLALAVAFGAVALADETHMSANETKVFALDFEENFHQGITYTVSGSGPQLVSVEISTDTPLCGKDEAGQFDFPRRPGLAVAPFSVRFANVLMPGDYYMWFNNGWAVNDKPHSATVTIATAAAQDGVEQDTPYEQQQELGETPLKGALWCWNRGDDNWEQNDRDCFKLTLDKDARVNFTLKCSDHQAGLRIERYNFEDQDTPQWADGIDGGDQWFGTREPLSTPVSRTFSYDLRQGVYRVTVFSDWEGVRTTRYEIGVQRSDLPAGEMYVAKAFTTTAGLHFYPFSYSLGGDFWPGVNCASSNAKVVAITDDMRPVAVKPGKATLTVISGGKTHKCKVTVLKNEFTRKKPLKSAWRGIYTSAKKISYGADNALNIEIFVYNNSGKTITSIGDPVVQLIAPVWDTSVRFAKNIPAIAFPKPIKQGKYGVVKVAIPYSEYASHFGSIMDLRSGELDANIALNASAKAASKAAHLFPLNAATPGAKEALNATE